MKTKIIQQPVNIRKVANAFTLIEVVVALSVLGTALIAIFGVLSVCSRAGHHNRMLTHAVLLAETQLTQIRISESPSYGTTKGTSGFFNWEVNIAQTEVEDLAAVKVDVFWKEQQRKQHYELLSLMKMKSYVEMQN